MVLNEGNIISHSAVLHFVDTLLDYTGWRGFDYSDITVVHKMFWYATRYEQAKTKMHYCFFYYYYY